MERVELLAPAGNYEGFLGAVHAGADAVYLGGMKFGARAYADNFSEEEICRAIRYAHIYGRKVYLTLNTLVKEKEFHEIYDYLAPLYDAGLDGVIIQDMGVFLWVGRWFPGLARHVSTQAAITGTWGARLLKKFGAQRIVPARELSLEEIRQMKREAGIEIETFIHGAVCYCYSGQCLFSSVIGGRSGNRGRCAQPCRLPYRMDGERKECYPLSLKDMCTIEMLPELVKAGIDSFKIEGRMKSPEYAAGVTALYRKYIDRYYRNPEAEFRVEKQDMEKLKALYLRSGISTGYYNRYNGRQMITLESPAYAGRDEELAGRIRRKYVEGDFRLPVQAKAVLKKGCPAILTLHYEGEGTGEAAEITVEGETVQAAQKQPLSRMAVEKQLTKSGNTVFCMEHIETDMQEDVFLPIKALNDLRRKACENLEKSILDRYAAADLCGRGRNAAADKNAAVNKEPEGGTALRDFRGKEEDGTALQNLSGKEEGGTALRDLSRRKEERTALREEGRINGGSANRIHVLALTEGQAMSAIRAGVQRLYLDSCLCREGHWLSELKRFCGDGTELYLALPYIIRMRDRKFLEETEKLLAGGIFDGVLARSPEELHWIWEAFGEEWEGRIVSDAGLYIWNREAERFYGRFGAEHYLPYELNAYEVRDLTEKTPEAEWAAAVYGRIPMMVTANCVVRTREGCRPYPESRDFSFCRLTDRYRKDFPVYTDCRHCYNRIYNSLPLSLHQDMDKMGEMGIHTFRLDFTDEIGNDVDRVISYFKGLADGQRRTEPPYKEYTKGHWKRGVE